MTPEELFALCAVIGLVPAFIAHNRGKDFLLWWVFGAALFIVALPLALTLPRDEDSIARREKRRQCPRCAEWIRQEATFCRFCQSESPAQVATASGHHPPATRKPFPTVKTLVVLVGIAIAFGGYVSGGWGVAFLVVVGIAAWFVPR